MTKTLKDHEQDLASKIGQMSEKAGATELVLLMAGTFQKHLMQRTDPSNPAHASLIALAEVIGAAVDTAEEFMKLDDPENAGITGIPGVSAESLYRITEAEITQGFLNRGTVMRECRLIQKSLHIVAERDFVDGARITQSWLDAADVITVENKAGETILILKNRFGATS